MKIYPPRPWKQGEVDVGELTRQDRPRIKVLCNRAAPRHAGDSGQSTPRVQAHAKQIRRMEESA